MLVSPCDGIVGAAGTVVGTELLQIKGAPYTLEDLFGDSDLAGLYCGGSYVTLRLTAGMYHRFHAPHDNRVESVTYIFSRSCGCPDLREALRRGLHQER